MFSRKNIFAEETNKQRMFIVARQSVKHTQATRAFLSAFIGNQLKGQNYEQRNKTN